MKVRDEIYCGVIGGLSLACGHQAADRPPDRVVGTVAARALRRAEGGVQLGPGSIPLDREALLHAVVSGGGAMLLAYAWFVWATDRATPSQVRGLVASGVGFLMSAAASVYLRERAVVGPTVSLVGCAIALVGMRAVLRDRLERQDAERRRRPGE